MRENKIRRKEGSNSIHIPLAGKFWDEVEFGLSSVSYVFSGEGCLALPLACGWHSHLRLTRQIGNSSVHFGVGTKIFRETVKSTIYEKTPVRETETLSRNYKFRCFLNFHTNILIFPSRKLETLHGFVPACVLFAFSTYKPSVENVAITFLH